MLTVNEMVPPSAECFDLVFKGMRLPLKSGYLSDSRVAQVVGKQFIAGEKDLGLADRLIKAGASDRKFLRQLPIVMEITADQVFWRQCDQYKIGTVTNSSSQMHRLDKTHYTMDDFNIPNLDKHTPDVVDRIENYISQINMFLNESNRKKTDGDPKWKDDWDFALSLVPQSVFYTKCWSLNYETAINIGLQREGHKNGAWDILIDYWKDNLPYYKDFLEAAKFKQNELKRLKRENKELKDKLSVLEENFDTMLDWYTKAVLKTRLIREERDDHD